LIYGAGAVAVQDQGGIDVRFIGNTMWDNYYGSLWLRASPYSGALPQATVITDNIMQGFQLLNGAEPISESHNLIVDGPEKYRVGATGAILVQPESPAGYQYGSGDLVGVNPEFANEPEGNFQLMPGSPAVADGTSSYNFAVDNPESTDPGVLKTDMFGQVIVSPVALGALQVPDPSVAWGAPAYHSEWPLTYTSDRG
jgi:hypothetical protein